MEEIIIGVVDRTITVFIPDPASTDGSGKTGLVAADLTVSYTRVETDNDVTVTDVTSSLNNLSALTDAHNDWGLKEVSSTLAPGLYRLDLADAVFATGAWYAVVYVMITTSAAAATPKAFKLVAGDATTNALNVAAVASLATDSVSAAALATDAVTEISAATAALLNVYTKNVAVTGFMFAMVTSAGAAATGLTVAATISKDGGAFAAVAAAVAEVSGGWYKVDLAQAEMNADEIALKFTATGALQANVKIRTQS